MASSSRKRLFSPESSEPFALSRSKLELFLECSRCFYLDRRLGIARPEGPPFTLNLAVDHLLKKEFDLYRAKAEPHPLMVSYGVEAVPFRHPELSTWRDTPTGIRTAHSASGMEVFGIIDDVWVHPDGTLAMVDYKATSTVAAITLDNRDSYRRQLEVYSWLFKRNGFDVSSTGYFVFVNGRRDPELFNRRLEFHMQILPSHGSDAWLEEALMGVRECLEQDSPPQYTEGCVWCGYRRERGEVES